MQATSSTLQAREYFRKAFLTLPGEVREYFRQTGALGGKRRAARYSKAQLSAWGKLGGRPRKSDKQGPKKGGK